MHESSRSVFSPEWLNDKDPLRAVREMSDEETTALETANFPSVEELPLITEVVPGGPADLAGLKAGDVILSLNENTVKAMELSVAFQKLNGKPGALKILGKNGATRDLFITPKYNEASGMWSTGVFLDTAPEEMLLPELKNYGPCIIRFSLDLGDRIGKIPVTVELSQVLQENTGKRRINSYSILYNQNGKQKMFDYLDYLGNSGIEVIYDPSISTNGKYHPIEKTVVVKAISHHSVLHTLAHEFRHAYQFSKAGYKELGISMDPNLYYPANFLEKQRPYVNWFQNNPKEALKKALMTSGLFKQMNDVTDFLAPLVNNNQLSLDTDLIPGASVEEILKIPTLVAERDADYGAMITLRKVSQVIGIDLHGGTSDQIYSVQDNHKDGFQLKTCVQTGGTKTSLVNTKHMEFLEYNPKAMRAIKKAIADYYQQE